MSNFIITLFKKKTINKEEIINFEFNYIYHFLILINEMLYLFFYIFLNKKMSYFKYKFLLCLIFYHFYNLTYFFMYFLFNLSFFISCKIHF
jgi:hypothetical protein